MTALREAAQQALKSLEEAIKVWTEEMEFRSCVSAADAWIESAGTLRDALAQPAPEPEPEPEPVAWMCSDEELLHKGYSRFSKTCVGAWNIPVYTAPPQRKPLTDEEIARIMQPFEAVEPEHPFWVDVARAIERAHGIGSEE